MTRGDDLLNVLFDTFIHDTVIFDKKEILSLFQKCNLRKKLCEPLSSMYLLTEQNNYVTVIISHLVYQSRDLGCLLRDIYQACFFSFLKRDKTEVKRICTLSENNFI